MNGPLAWCPASVSAGQEFLQIHVPEADTICAIALQGTGVEEGMDYVTEYFVAYSVDDEEWHEIKDGDGNLKVFKGNDGPREISKQVLPVPVKANYVRIYPLSYESWPCLRVELYGKEKERPPSETGQGESTPPPEEEITSPPGGKGETTSPPGKEEEEEITTAPEELQCDPVGAEYGGALPDSSFSASSDSGDDYSASKARLNGPSAWCPVENFKPGTYLQIELPTEMSVCAIGMQGFEDFGAWVKRYTVAISPDGQESWEEMVMEGNVNSVDPSLQRLPKPTRGQFVRIYPMQYEVFPCLKVEIYAIATGKFPHPKEPEEEITEENTPTPETPTGEKKGSPPPPLLNPPIPTTVPPKGMDIGIVIGVTESEFETIKVFISRLVIYISKHFPNVQFGLIIYSDRPELIMTLRHIKYINVKVIIEGMSYVPGGHRTDLAMLYASRKLFCPVGCEDRPEEQNVMVLFTSKKTDAGSIPYSIVTPIMKNCSSNIIAVGLSDKVSKSELVQIALGSPERVLQYNSMDSLDSNVIYQISTMIEKGPVVKTVVKTVTTTSKVIIHELP